MHGRPREYKNKLKDPKAAEAYAKKVAAIKQGTALVLECRRQCRYDPAALKASEKLLKVVPEVGGLLLCSGWLLVLLLQQSRQQSNPRHGRRTCSSAQPV
jgi:hypothetical protein